MRANVSPCRSQASRISAMTLVASLALSLGGCFGRSPDVTGSIAAGSPATQRQSTEQWASRYRANPSDKTAALGYAKALREQTQYNQAAAVLENVAIKSPYDQEVLAAYGKALADAGRLKEAAGVLARAHTPENPNWSVLSAQGSVADQLGDHAGAQGYYAAALKIKPGEPRILSNLGLSYALDNRLNQAETTMRQASESPDADARVRQNFALVLALDGKFTEAEQVAERDLSPADAAASVAAIRGMIAQSNTWSTIQRNAGRSSAASPRAKVAAADGS